MLIFHSSKEEDERNRFLRGNNLEVKGLNMKSIMMANIYIKDMKGDSENYIEKEIRSLMLKMFVTMNSN